MAGDMVDVDNVHDCVSPAIVSISSGWPGLIVTASQTTICVSVFVRVSTSVSTIKDEIVSSESTKQTTSPSAMSRPVFRAMLTPSFRLWMRTMRLSLAAISSHSAAVSESDPSSTIIICKSVYDCLHIDAMH